MGMPRGKTAKRRSQAPAASNGRGKTSPRQDGTSLKEESEEVFSAEDIRSAEPVARLPAQSVDAQCPYCGETIDIHVDPSEEGQVLIQDCDVCCKPVQFSVEIDEGEISVSASRT